MTPPGSTVFSNRNHENGNETVAENLESGTLCSAERLRSGLIQKSTHAHRRNRLDPLPAQAALCRVGSCSSAADAVRARVSLRSAELATPSGRCSRVDLKGVSCETSRESSSPQLPCSVFYYSQGGVKAPQPVSTRPHSPTPADRLMPPEAAHGSDRESPTDPTVTTNPRGSASPPNRRFWKTCRSSAGTGEWCGSTPPAGPPEPCAN